MLYGSVSVKGSYHDENQDSCYSGMYNNIYVLIVSDGLGSKLKSKLGSQRICESIIEAIEKLEDSELIVEEFLKDVHRIWMNKLKYQDINQCYATVLACIVMPNNIIAFRLGDGFLSIVLKDKIKTLFDKKENCFENETDCMAEDFCINDWEILDIENNDFLGVIACSDGVEIKDMYNNGYSEFAKEFIDSYKLDRVEDIKKDIKNWLLDWPGHDDKTVAFMIKESEEIDE